TQAVCIPGEGKATDPKITYADTDEIHYSIDGKVEPGESVVIVAELQNPGDHKWDTAAFADGWTVDSEGNATLTVTLDSPTGLRDVTPVAPKVAQAECVALTGDATDPSVTMKDTDDIEYTRSGELVPGGEVTITAALKSDKLAWDDDLPDGWSIDGDGNAKLT